jgi:hypothetical protein
MAKMKEIYIEVLNLFDGHIPENFDFDEYINKKIQEKNEPEKRTY